MFYYHLWKHSPTQSFGKDKNKPRVIDSMDNIAFGISCIIFPVPFTFSCLREPLFSVITASSWNGLGDQQANLIRKQYGWRSLEKADFYYRWWLSVSGRCYRLPNIILIYIFLFQVKILGYIGTRLSTRINKLMDQNGKSLFHWLWIWL